MKFPIKHLLLLLLMVCTAALASVMRPTGKLSDQLPPMDLENMVPRQFGQWRELTNVAMQVVNPEQQEVIDTIYSQTLSRIYMHNSGYRVMLAVAYGNDQSDQLQLHKPEICYPAQGFVLDNTVEGRLNLADKSIPVTQLLTHLGQRNEPVTYWTMVGDQVAGRGFSKKLIELGYSLNGTVPDGMLVRVSSVDREPDRAFQLQADFAAAMVAAIAPEHRPRFAGLNPQRPKP